MTKKKESKPQSKKGGGGSKFIKKNNKKQASNYNNKGIVLDAVEALGKEASLRKLFPKVIKQLSQEEIILALNALDREGKIKIEDGGDISYLLKPRAKKASVSSKKSENEFTMSPSNAAKASGNPSKRERFMYGTMDISRTGAGYVEVDGLDKDVFINPRAVGKAMKGDEVKIRITAYGRRPEGEVVDVVRRAQDSFQGRIDVLEKFAFFIADEKKLSTDVFVPLTALNGAKHGERVIVRIMDWNTGNKNPIGEVVEVLSGKSSSDLDMKMILIQNGFSIDFPLEVYRELEKYGEEIPKEEAKNRIDMRDVLTITIDPEDAKDFDDAISFRRLKNGNYEVGVHIADVSYFVREGTALDKEAEKRATSVYLPDRVCPMLPEKLSNVLCSLRPGEDKLTFATLFEIDEKFNIVHYSIARTIIHSDRRFTYEEAQQVLETGEGDHAQELQILDRIAKDIRAKRMKKGAIAFEKAEVRFKLDENGKPLGIVLKIRKDAHLLVEDFMLLANETVAKYGAKLRQGKKQLPFVYRVHDEPDLGKLEQFSAIAARFGHTLRFDENTNVSAAINAILQKVEGKPEANVIETMAIRSMAKAEYTTNNIGHYGLAMEYYTHFTSPIRRYPDVLVHRLLEHILTQNETIIDRDDLEARCKNSSLMERKAMDAEREATKYKQIEFLQDKVGEEFDGIVTGVIAKGIFVEMNDNKCEGMVSLEMLGDEDFTFDERMLRLTGNRSRKRYELGTPVRVKILSADLALRRIDLGLADEE